MNVLDISRTTDTGTISRAGAEAVSSTGASRASGISTSEGLSGGDRVDLSAQGKLLSKAAEIAGKLKDIPDTRQDVIDRAKKLLESGELFSKDNIRKAARNLKPFIE